MTCGIYLLRFKNTEKVYIGQSLNIENRFKGHKYAFLHNKHSEKVQYAYNTYGMPSLEILCECNPNELDIQETEAINIFDSINNGFNTRQGSTVGAGCPGELNGRAKYSNEVYEQVFFALLDNIYNYKEISEMFNVSIQIVDHISSGTSHKKWLEKKYPQEYQKLMSLINTRNNITLELINSTTNQEITITSLLDFSKKTGIPKSTLSGLATGALSHAGPWVLKYPVKYTPRIKNNYTLAHPDHGVITFSNVLGFCRQYNLESNRKQFSTFLKTASIGNEYKGWKLVTIT